MVDPITVKIIQMLLFISIGSVIFIVIAKVVENKANEVSNSKIFGSFIYLLIFVGWYIYIIWYWFNLLQEAQS